MTGADVMIFKIFSPKNSAKKLAFLTQNEAKLCKILIITLVFEKNANFFRRKLSKIAGADVMIFCGCCQLLLRL
jgi:Ni,Fe-hydrogenase III small subunit